MKNKKQTNEQLIVKDNRLIQAHYKLDLNEQKIVLFAISKIKPKDKDFQTYSFEVKNFLELLDLWHEKKGYQTLKKATKSILSKPLSIYPQNSDIIEIQCNWFSSIVYRQGTITFKISEELKPYLLELKKCFTTFQLEQILQLKSSYSIRLYEILKSRLNLSKYTVELKQLRLMLNIENKYPLFANFKAKILNVAKKELNKKSDIKFTYKTIKTGKKVEKIQFTIVKNELKTNSQGIKPGNKIMIGDKIFTVSKTNSIMTDSGVLAEGYLNEMLQNNKATIIKV